jgi:hypothetical protein
VSTARSSSGMFGILSLDFKLVAVLRKTTEDACV